MLQTARSRFAAAKRLQARDRKITRLAAFSSADLIVLTIIPYFLELPTRIDDHVSLIAAFMAVVVLVTSLLQYSRLDVVAAEQHHRSGLEINEIVRDFDGSPGDVGADSYRELAGRYGGVLHKYSVNHEDTDFWAVMLDRPQDYPWLTGVERYRRWLRVAWDRMIPDLFLFIITAGFLLFIVLYVVPQQEPAQTRTNVTGAP